MTNKLTISRALDTIKECSPDEDMVLTVQFNTDDEWGEGTLAPRGYPSDDWAIFSGEGKALIDRINNTDDPQELTTLDGCFRAVQEVLLAQHRQKKDQ